MVDASIREQITDDIKQIIANDKQTVITKSDIDENSILAQYPGLKPSDKEIESFSNDIDLKISEKYGLAKNKSEWETVKLNNIVLPGLVKIRVNFDRDVNQEKRKGYDYTKLKDYGSKSKVVTLNITMNGHDYKAYRAVIRPIIQLSSFNPNENNIVDISNVLLDDYGISQVVLLSTEQDSPSAGITNVTITFIEYHEEVKRTVKNADIKSKARSVKQGDGTNVDTEVPNAGAVDSNTQVYARK